MTRTVGVWEGSDLKSSNLGMCQCYPQVTEMETGLSVASGLQTSLPGSRPRPCPSHGDSFCRACSSNLQNPPGGPLEETHS